MERKPGGASEARGPISFKIIVIANTKYNNITNKVIIQTRSLTCSASVAQKEF